MRVVCAPSGRLGARKAGELQIVLYGHPDRSDRGSAGTGIREAVKRAKLQPSDRAWDLLTIALSVVAADTGVRRDTTPDGWTRDIELRVSVIDPDFWNQHRQLLEHHLRILTNDRWSCGFVEGSVPRLPPRKPVRPPEEAISLLSGGLDSFIGAIDLVEERSQRPFVVSQVAQGDKDLQSHLASLIGGGLAHLQLNHNANCPGTNERSQRSRSIIFLAYGVLIATALRQYDDGAQIPLYVCENGFISINPPLTLGRIGSLSTRTTHPLFLSLFQKLLDAGGLRARIHTPYQFLTKGEMLSNCANQALLEKKAHRTTSCGRFARNKYRHCGRCVPCLVRRAAFYRWGVADKTVYVYSKLGRDDADHARFDDVRSAAMAVAQVRAEGLDSWLGTSLSSYDLGDLKQYMETVGRGLEEIGAFLDAAKVK